MEFSQLEAFLEVVETSSFLEAAQRLFVSQPAISKRIALLEEELQKPLFNRLGRQISLTEAGRRLIPQAKQILWSIQDCKQSMRALSHQVSGILNLGTSHHIGLHRLPPVLKNYSKKFPEVHFNFKFMGSEDVCRVVESGEIELGIVTLPTQTFPMLQRLKIWEDSLAIVVGKTHPLTGLKTCSVAQLSQYAAILPSPETHMRVLMEEIFRHQKKALRISFSTNYLETIKMMVQVGIAWSVLPHTMISSDLKKITLKGVRFRRDLGVVWHTRRTLSNPAQKMLEQLQEFSA